MELGLLGIALVLLAKEAGVPVPVPGDLVVLGAGVAAARGDLDPAAAGIVIVAATVAGGLGQFLLLRGRARRAVLGLLERVGIGRARVESLAALIARRGARGVALARVTPGVRIAAIPAAAVGGVPLPSFAAGLAAGNATFSGGHYLGGYLLGEAALEAVRAAGPALLAAGVAVAVLGAAGWWLIARRRRSPAGAGASAWSDAACPACLAIAVPLGRLVDPASTVRG